MSDILILNKSQMDQLSQRFRQKAEAVSELQAEVTSLLSNTTWDGNRARQFRDQWATVFSPNLTKLQQAFSDNATFITQERANAVSALD